MGAQAGGLPEKRKSKHSKYSVYELCSGKIRRPRWDYSKTSAIEGTPPPLSPEEYLFARHSSLRSYPYEEDPELPDNTLINTIHWYISQKLKNEGREEAFEVYDGSALLAIAIQVEEEIKALLGTNGHLLFAQNKSHC